jgi:hypothetical protein
VASDWENFCQAAIADLQTNVLALTEGSVLVHPLVPYDPEELAADGERHLSVFPIAETAQQSQPLTTAGVELVEVYRILYWEGADDESSRGVADVDAARSMLDLAQAVKDRYLTTDTATLSGAFRVRYIGTVFPDRSGQVRWFAVGVEAHRAQDIV